MRKTTAEGTSSVLLVAVPICGLLYMALSWLKFGVDLPYFDDWSSYLAQGNGSFTPSYLFKSTNDTMFPVGKFLDSLAERALNGNSVAYQLISMVTVLGTCLWLQWKLLTALLDDGLLAATAFLATVFMLQPGSYWGDPNRAYHQALPLVCLLASLYLILLVDRPSFVKLPLLFLLGLISGLSYTSGAFGMLAAAIVMLAFGLALPGRRSFVPAAIAIGTAGLITASMQAWVIIVVQGGHTHRPDAPWATPLDADFWLYILGKVGRSLNLSDKTPAISLVITLLAIGLSAALILAQARRVLARRETDDRHVDRVFVTLVLFAVVGTYLAMVAAGRTNLRDPSIQAPLDVFASAFPRFHFFWVTLLWPWVIAALLVVLTQKYGRRIAAIAASLLAGAIITFTMLAGGLDHGRFFKVVGNYRVHHIQCLQERLLTSDRLVCPQYFRDLTPAYAFAVGIGSSFVNAAPPSLRKLNTSPALQIFDLSRAGPTSLAVRNADVLEQSGGLVDLAAHVDTMIVFSADDPAKLENCMMLMLRASIAGPPGEIAELFYVPKGRADFSAEFSARSPIGQPVEIVVSSWTGFSNTLRLDPVAAAGRVSVADLSVRCLVLRS